MQVIEIAESFRGLGILLIAKGFRPDVILPNDTSFLTIRDFQASTKFLRRTVRFHAFRRFREAVLQKSEARQLLIDYWMGHENDDMSTRYGKQLLEDVRYRKEWAEKIGLGFDLPAPKPALIGLRGLQNEGSVVAA